MLQTSKQTDVLILGLGVGGIGTLRLLKHCPEARVYGVVFDSENEKGRFTRLCTVLKWPDPKYDSSGFKQKLIRWSADRETVIVFVTRDEEVYWLAEHADMLPPHLLWYRNSPELIKCLDNKILSAQLASSCGLRVPSSYPIFQKAIPSGFVFPGIIKPSGIPPNNFPHKNLIVEDGDGFYTALDTYPCLFNASVLQEYIPGGDDQVYQCTALIGTRGTMLGSIEIRKLRQYPVKRGIACFAYTLLHRELSDLCNRLVQQSGITGFISVEFKKDYRNGQWVFIEANLRMPGYNSLFECTDINFARMYISDLLGEYRHSEKLENSRKYYWMREELDLSNVVNKRVNIGIIGWLKDIIRTDAFAFWHSDDPMPGMANFVRIVKSFLNMLIRIIQNKLSR